MTQIKKYVETYRSWDIVRVVERTQFLDEGPSERMVGFEPRISLSMRRNPKYSSRSYSLGLPRSLDKVKEWIDRQEKMLDREGQARRAHG